MKKAIVSIIIIALVLIVGSWLMFYKVSNSDEFEKNNSYLDIDQNTNNQASSTNTIIGDKKESTSTTIKNNDINKKYMNAILHTSMGDITIELKKDGVPNTVANFTKLAGEKFYDGVKFHRVIKGFMVQGGDPLTKDDSKKSIWGTGGPGYSFADELNVDNSNDIGTISMANAGPNTNGSQFFINVAPNNFLDKKHVVFGKIIAGMDIVKLIEGTPTDSMDRPLTSVTINSITLK
jgi:peptidylprolyl isomerase